MTLTEFVKHLGRSGIVHVDENEKGVFISWIDNSPKALAKQAASQAKERADMDDEQRERKILAEQIRKAQEMAAQQQPQASGSSGQEEPNEAPKPVKMAPISISFGSKPSTPAEEQPEKPPTDVKPTPEASTSAGPTPTDSTQPAPAPAGGLKMGMSLKKPNALKSGGNALKSASTAAREKEKERKAAAGGGHSMSAAEQLMAEDLERKRRIAERQERDERSASFLVCRSHCDAGTDSTDVNRDRKRQRQD